MRLARYLFKKPSLNCHNLPDQNFHYVANFAMHRCAVHILKAAYFTAIAHNFTRLIAWSSETNSLHNKHRCFFSANAVSLSNSTYSPKLFHSYHFIHSCLKHGPFLNLPKLKNATFFLFLSLRAENKYLTHLYFLCIWFCRTIPGEALSNAPLGHQRELLEMEAFENYQ